ncbi:MAG: citrate transporter [Betaproteobacteria bacterium]|nr:citrate transporter [Betaproteobacteria bacterium]
MVSLTASAQSALGGGPSLLGIPVDFILFAATLLGVAFFHKRSFYIAIGGMLVIVAYKFGFTGFKQGPGLEGFLGHMGHEWVILTNLLALLTGFALLAEHFQDSKVPDALPAILPNDWVGPLVLLALVFVLSAFLDNIAAAMIGGAVALTVFGRVHIGYVAAIVAASNAGGSGSVVGDTTTTMMWIAGVNPIDVLHSYVAAGAAFVIFGVIAARQQHAYYPITSDPKKNLQVDWSRVAIVMIILLAAIAVNVVVNRQFNAVADRFPFIGVAVWVAILLTATWRQPSWSKLPEAARGAVFLLSLVMAASLMPVEKLPTASAMTAFGLGFVSAVFDNIPLTALAIKQDGYDWGGLAYAVGFGGSMIWFGSSAGVAIATIFPEARSVGSWLRHGWHVALAYVIGFAMFMLTMGWNPHPITS